MLLYEKHAEDFRISRAHNWDFIPHAHHNLEILICTSRIRCQLLRSNPDFDTRGNDDRLFP